MRRQTILFILVLLALVGALAVKGLLVQPPALRNHSNSGEFDAVRAKQRLVAILGNEAPHPSDSVGSDLVRSRLIAQLRGLGVKPIVRDQFVCNELYKQRGVSCARVRNVIVQLSTGNGKALLLNAHYDSTPVGPAAADDGVGVATLLEVAKILPSEILHARPIILLFNEGEELGLLGARAFLADPLSRNVDSLINLEARGVRGPVNMFETSRPNMAPISVFASQVKNPVANSLSTDVYRLLPNYTDVNSFSERGWLTLNFAPVGNETRYHSAGDNIAALDLKTLQHMGDQVLAMTKGLNFGTPKANRGDRIFMDVAGRALIVLPLAVGGVLAVGLLIAFATLSIRRGGLLRGVAVVVGSLVGSTVLSWAILALVGALRQGMFWRAHPVWTHLTVNAAAILVTLVFLATAGNGLDRTRLRPVFWLMFLIVGGGIGFIAPGCIIFFIFPPLIALFGIIAARWWQQAERAGAIAALLFLYLTWGAMLGLLEELLNSGPMWVLAPLGSLCIVPVLIEARPLIADAGIRAATAISGSLTLIGTGLMLATPAYSADRQQRFVIQHVSDVAHGKSWWSILDDGARLPTEFPGSWYRGELSFSERSRWISPAPADPAAHAPDVQLISENNDGNERTLTVRLVANGNEHIDLIASPDARIRAAGVPGFVRRIDQAERGKYFISCFGRSCDGATMQLKSGKLQPIEFTVLGGKGVLQGIASTLVGHRPAFARPQYNRDESIALRTRSL